MNTLGLEFSSKLHCNPEVQSLRHPVLQVGLSPYQGNVGVEEWSNPPIPTLTVRTIMWF